MPEQPRRPAGAPSGGQFAATDMVESDLDLATTPKHSDSHGAEHVAVPPIE